MLAWWKRRVRSHRYHIFRCHLVCMLFSNIHNQLHQRRYDRFGFGVSGIVQMYVNVASVYSLLNPPIHSIRRYTFEQHMELFSIAIKSNQFVIFVVHSWYLIYNPTLVSSCKSRTRFSIEYFGKCDWSFWVVTVAGITSGDCVRNHQIISVFFFAWLSQIIDCLPPPLD